MPETIRKQKREIDQLNAKLQMYRDMPKGNEEEETMQQQQRSKNQLDNEDHNCPLCSQVKYCVTNDRMMMISGPIVEKVVECMPSPQGYMAAALLRAVFLHYVGNDDENMMSQIQFIVFATDCELVNKQNQSPMKTHLSLSRSCIEVSELWRIVFDTYRSSSTTVTQSTTGRCGNACGMVRRCQNHSLNINQHHSLENRCMDFDDFVRALMDISSHLYKDLDRISAMSEFIKARIVPMSLSLMMERRHRDDDDRVVTDYDEKYSEEEMDIT